MMPKSAVMKTFSLALVGMLSISVSGGLIVWKKGFENRLPDEVLKITAAQKDSKPYRQECHQPDIKNLRDKGACKVLENSSIPVRFFSFGDSFSNSLFPALEEMARKYNVNGLQSSYSSCPPVFGIERYKSLGGQYRYQCREFNDAVRKLIKDNDLHDVILFARWGSYYDRYIVGDSANHPPKILQESTSVFLSGFSSTMDYFAKQNIRVWIVTQPPEYDVEVPHVLARMKMASVSSGLQGMSRDFYEQQRKQFHTMFKKAAAKHDNVHIIEIADIICPEKEQSCLIEKDGHALYRDSHHLSSYGIKLASVIMEGPFRVMAGDHEK